MKILEIVFLVFFIMFFLFGKIKVNGKTTTSITQKFAVSIIMSVFLSAIIGFPLLGAIYLFKTLM